MRSVKKQPGTRWVLIERSQKDPSGWKETPVEDDAVGNPADYLAMVHAKAYWKAQRLYYRENGHLWAVRFRARVDRYCRRFRKWNRRILERK